MQASHLGGSTVSDSTFLSENSTCLLLSLKEADGLTYVSLISCIHMQFLLVLGAIFSFCSCINVE